MDKHIEHIKTLINSGQPSSIGLALSLIKSNKIPFDLAPYRKLAGWLNLLERKHWNNKFIVNRRSDVAMLVSLMQCRSLSLTVSQNLLEEIDLMKNLRSLSIRGDDQFNTITRLPSTIGNLKQLTSLEISRTKVTHLPASLWQLSSLEKLEITGSPLLHLPSQVQGLSSLVTLVLRGSELQDLPEELGKLSKLEVLDINACFGITRWPRSLTKTPLRVFSCIYTGMSIPEKRAAKKHFQLAWKH